MIKKLALGLVSSMLLTSASNATTIDFTGEAAGAKPNGYTIAGVTFNDTLGANLEVGDFGVQSIGDALAVRGDDASTLEMLFSSTSKNLSLVFGNDDPFFTTAGDVALLRLFLGASQVGQTSVVLNRDDIANQTISLLGINFDRAIFAYTNAAFDPINLIEVVDNISFDAANAVPEPATWAMMLGGFGLLGAAARRRSRTVTYAS